MRNVVSRFSVVLAVILFFSASVLAQDETGQQDQTQENQIPQEQIQQDQTQQDQTTTPETQENKQFETSAQQLTDNLAAKITLTDEQRTEIKGAISEYYGMVIETDDEEGSTGDMQNQEGTEQATETTDDADQWLSDEIAGILEDTQLTQWEVTKADFMNQLRDNVATLQQNKNLY